MILFYPLLTLSYILRLLPNRLVLLAGDLLGLVWFYLIPIRRTVVLNNLKLAYENLRDPEIFRLARSNYRHYGRTLFELIRSLSWTAEDFHKNIYYHGAHHLDRIRSGESGAFLLTLHIGNWELAIGATAAQGVSLSVVVKKGTSQFFRELQERYRGRQGVTLLEESRTATDILRDVRAGRLVAFVLDQFMGPPIGLPVRFFGKEAGTAAALALLTERRSAEIILAHSYRDSAGKIHMVFEKVTSEATATQLSGRLFEKTQGYNDTLETIVKSHPEQWMWLHRRWKPYNGVPRWLKPAPILASLVFYFIVGCTTTPIQTPTGIAIPEERAIQVPNFSVATEPPTIPAVTAVPTPGVPVKKSAHGKKTAQPSVSPTVTPVPSPAPFWSLPVDKIPFELGERMEVDLTWMALPAGRAVLEVRPGPDFNGRPTRWLWGNILSSRLVDTIYHLDNTIESYVDQEGVIPYKFLLHMVETHQKKETRVLFDHPNKRAFYWAKRLSQKWGDLDIDRADELVPAAKDMFSALYFSRLFEYRLGEGQKISVFENGQNWEVEVSPVANELVKSKAGIFQCWKLMVKMRLNNVLSQTGDIAMWLSDDSKRYLVKFDAKVKIGSLLGTLVSVRDKL